MGTSQPSTFPAILRCLGGEMSKLNPHLCSPVIEAAWMASERPDLWSEEHQRLRPALEQVVQVLDQLQKILRVHGSTTSTSSSLPGPGPTKDLMHLLGCRHFCASLRELKSQPALERVRKWVVTLAAGTPLASEDSAQVQLFFQVLSRVTVGPAAPMCGVPLRGTHHDDFRD